MWLWLRHCRAVRGAQSHATGLVVRPSTRSRHPCVVDPQTCSPPSFCASTWARWTIESASSPLLRGKSPPKPDTTHWGGARSPRSDPCVPSCHGARTYVSSAVFHTTLSAAQAVYRTFLRPGVRHSADRWAAPPSPVPEGPSVWGPSACRERLSHWIGTHPTPFMPLASRSLLGSGCSCRLKTPGQGVHGVLAPPTLSMSDSLPQTSLFFFGWPAPVPAGSHAYNINETVRKPWEQSEHQRFPSKCSLLRSILTIAWSYFEHLVDEHYARPVLLYEWPESPSYGCSADCCAFRRPLNGKVQPMSHWTHIVSSLHCSWWKLFHCQIYRTDLKVALPRLYRVCHVTTASKWRWKSPTEMAFVGAP